VIPIQNQSGQFVAELDIDSNRLASFSKEIEDKFKKHCLSFPFKEDYIPLNPKLTIESDRLILRPILESDLPAIFDYAKREDVAKFVTFNAHETLEDTKKFFQYAKKEYANGFMEPLGITLKENPHLVIGTIGLKTKSSKHFSAEFGYALHPNFWGQNIMSEALKTFIDYAFTHLPYNRLQAHCMDENLASGRVMEKAGMKYEGTYREVMFVKEKMRTLKCYAILKREWKK
jgi:ribosomal-protein-alanine N-acetyltransferase